MAVLSIYDLGIMSPVKGARLNGLNGVKRRRRQKLRKYSLEIQKLPKSVKRLRYVKINRLNDFFRRLLTELTTPLECLFATVDIERTEQGAQTLFELKHHLQDIKNIFLDPKVSKSILNHMERILERGEDMGTVEQMTLTHSVTLMRNILHIPEENRSESTRGSESNSETSPDCTSGEANSGDTPIEMINYGANEDKNNPTVNTTPQK